MLFEGRTAALYGRFSPRVRARFAREIGRRGGRALRDLTRACDVLVVGALATALVKSGALDVRLAAARERGVEVLGERAFAAALKGQPKDAPTLPLAALLAETGLGAGEIDLLTAFDLVAAEAGCCRFADAGMIRAAADLIGRGRSRADVVRMLTRVRDLAPRGRHRIVLTEEGEAALQWADGPLTSLEGQGFLALDGRGQTLDDLFEAAAVAEGEGRLDEAAGLYDQCARADRSCAVAPYNLGNVRLAQGAHTEAIIAYRRALGRDASFAEARYNLAQALEAAGKQGEAGDELERLLQSDPTHADALFNLAQLKMRAGALAAAKALYERYLDLNPPAEWAAMAHKALRLCAAELAFGQTAGA
jgi:tetratricopeptide (TPR) repeat protein